MKRKVTIQDIANMVNVSKSSVSRYLNNGYISEEKAKKIQEAIEKTGFETNFFAKRLKTKNSKLIGIVLPRVDSVTVGKLLTGINRALDKNDYQGIILISELDIEKEISNINNLYQQGVDGIIINAMAITKEHIQLVNKLNIPIMFTGQKSDYVNYMKIDDYEAGNIMGDYFKKNGHKRVVFLGVDEWDIAVGIDRKKGFIDEFNKNNLNSDVKFIETDFSFKKAYEKAKEAVDYKPTAIVCATDNICLGVLRYLHENNIRVPEDISIAGFGGYDIGSVSYPTLTTVAFDYELIGEKTAQGILDLINEKDINKDDNSSLKLIERESVRKIT
ncbi:LacI family DNA-binding transcriptional regulator [Clostridium botulinum]|uniref:LacI family DNA-binding transcriptional regulator n=1 Tax=Clostridium botulinum TaxID=1491 RepID=UPI0006A6CCB9|nr:LacI family DNA-binding transcriptional regulator [Clostridium botulinum]KAI3350177.1 LacI family DNA-binding transcriptional regulator [Clostridium botulinum]KOM88989.1 LacI family transcriptional regulator [Clostridium botulinum]KOR63555.1 LacI family transcriptional regulator [Clostridium botulinum]MBN1079088.1 trehalose repressor [Clostridium botulinum]NFR79668.1 trehalose repressor [Clostridium botulinum]